MFDRWVSSLGPYNVSPFTLPSREVCHAASLPSCSSPISSGLVHMKTQWKSSRLRRHYNIASSQRMDASLGGGGQTNSILRLCKWKKGKREEDKEKVRENSSCLARTATVVHCSLLFVCIWKSLAVCLDAVWHRIDPLSNRPGSMMHV